MWDFQNKQTTDIQTWNQTNHRHSNLTNNTPQTNKQTDKPKLHTLW